jgi:hypothetical protein
MAGRSLRVGKRSPLMKVRRSSPVMPSGSEEDVAMFEKLESDLLLAS